MTVTLTAEGASAAAGMPVLVVPPDLADPNNTTPGPLPTPQLAYLVDVAQQSTRLLNHLAAGATPELVEELVLELNARVGDYLDQWADLVDCPGCGGDGSGLDERGRSLPCGACDATGQVRRGLTLDPAWCDVCGVAGRCPECER